MELYFSPNYGASQFEIETTRKSVWIAQSLQEYPIVGVYVKPPAPITKEQLRQVHASDYIRAIETGDPPELAESQGFRWDTDLWRMTTASNGGAVAAALTALHEGIAGSLSSGLHHAHPEHGRGFCTFNGLALAAIGSLEAGANRVLILDLDAHCGGGTAACSAMNEAIWQVDISTNRFDAYEESSRMRLDVVGRSAVYLPCIEYHLQELDRKGIDFSICLYNAGMDPHAGCGTGGMNGITTEMLVQRDQMVFNWCRQRSLPIAFLTAGGYVGPGLGQKELVDLHRSTVQVAVDFAN